ncbi:MAG: hypothetical protein HJJLKODD_01055 [Phycisphaerae bacterium]|nr:hypothetical protein [Phycisphaerae bacterium]
MRAWQQVRYLSERHRLWLAAFVDTEEDYQYLPQLRERCHRFEAVPLNKKLALSRGGFNLLRGRTLTEGYYGCEAMWRTVHQWVEEKIFFDAALAFSSSMAPYLEELPVGRRVLDMNDLDSEKWQRYAASTSWPMSSLFRVEADRLATRERELIAQYDLTLMVNDRECNRVTDPVLRAKVQSFHTPIDVTTYDELREVHRDKIIGYTGTMDYKPNIEAVLWFAREVWPQVKQQHADAEWWIVGRNPGRDIQNLAEDPQIKVTGAVRDIRDYLRRMRVYIAPVQTELGVQTKVLEALAAGRPVVITTQGHQGIWAEDGRDYLVADRPQPFAERVCDLLNNHARCVELSRAGVELARRNYGTDVLMPRFEELLVGAVAPQGSAA